MQPTLGWGNPPPDVVKRYTTPSRVAGHRLDGHRDPVLDRGAGWTIPRGGIEEDVDVGAGVRRGDALAGPGGPIYVGLSVVVGLAAARVGMEAAR